MKKQKFSIIIAVDDKNGIGKNGTLPWRIKEDMQFFRTLTTITKKNHRQNAVIMGRKTWESIPEKHRPLPGRINCILSSSYKENPTIIGPTTFGFSDFEDCHIFLSKRVDIERIFIIGGSYLYNIVLDTPHLEKIYLTKVSGDFECDTFFSPIPERFIIEKTGEKKSVKDIEYQMLVYKNKEHKAIALPKLSKKTLIFSAMVVGVVLILLLISFLFQKEPKIQEPSPENDVQLDTPEETAQDSNPEIPVQEETEDTVIPEVVIPQEVTPDEPVKTEQGQIQEENYVIKYPLNTSVDEKIQSYIEEKKLEFKIQLFNAKRSGNEANWEIDYEISENEIIFRETKDGEQISERKIPLS